jgi:hypothetical protein
MAGASQTGQKNAKKRLPEGIFWQKNSPFFETICGGQLLGAIAAIAFSRSST